MESKSNQAALATKYFLDNFPVDVLLDKKEPGNKNEVLAHAYLSRLTEVFAVFDRLIRYEKYFREFLPPKESAISEAEATEYHLRSYIQDFYILQERIRKIVAALIADLPHYGFENEEDIKKALIHLSRQVHIKFKDITSGLRREHVHERSISEVDLIIGKFLSLVLSGEMVIPKGVVDENQMKNRQAEISASIKSKYQQQASDNAESLKKMKEWFASRFIYIFASLNGHKIEGLDLSS